MRMETFIRKALRLKAHRVVKVEEDEGAGELTVHLDRVGERRLRCGVCGRAARRVAGTRRPERRWRDLAMREYVVQLVYAPHRVWCQVCGLRVARVPVKTMLDEAEIVNLAPEAKHLTEPHQDARLPRGARPRAQPDTAL